MWVHVLSLVPLIHVRGPGSSTREDSQTGRFLDCYDRDPCLKVTTNLRQASEVPVNTPLPDIPGIVLKIIDSHLTEITQVHTSTCADHSIIRCNGPGYPSSLF
jgi:hypothetical protein